MSDHLQDFLVATGLSLLYLLLGWGWSRFVRGGRPLTRLQRKMALYAFLSVSGMTYAMMLSSWFNWQHFLLFAVIAAWRPTDRASSLVAATGASFLKELFEGARSGSTLIALGTIIALMSRLRRLVLSDRWFFITCRLLRRRRILSPVEFAVLAKVVDERRAEHGFLLTAWVFLPDHWHAIFYPRHPLTISRVMEAIKDGATKRINRSWREAGMLWQPRFFDRALRTVSDYNEKVQYIHLNPVKSGLVSRAEDWPWSSVHDYTGSVNDAPVTPSGLAINRVLLPADENTRI